MYFANNSIITGAIFSILSGEILWVIYYNFYQIQMFHILTRLHMNELYCFRVKSVQNFVSAQLLRNRRMDSDYFFADP
jgi:hypothetical protein